MRKLTTTTRGSARWAFTLVELLLVISIIAVIASLGVGVMAQAQNDAAQSATRSRIGMIARILETELEDYEVKRSPVPFQSLLDIVNASSLADDDTGRDVALLHVKNLKRIVIVDLIRIEMPDGSQATTDLSTFPSENLLEYLSEINVAPSVIANTVPTLSTGVTGDVVLTDVDNTDFSDADAVGKSELLYQILLRIDVDGVPAVDQLGSQAIGNTDGDTFPEIIDAWGEPIYLQWQQEDLLPVDGDLEKNIWESNGTFVGLSKEHTNAGFSNNYEYCKPVLPTQIRPVLISERLVEIDGVSADLTVGHELMGGI